jgi:hypothetical protein
MKTKAPTVKTFDEDLIHKLIKEMKGGKYDQVVEYIRALKHVIEMQNYTNALMMKKIRELSE